MQLHWELDGVRRNRNNILTVGTFDGVHLGHQFIIRELKRHAAKRGAQTTVVTFDPHPQLVLESPTKPDLQILTTTEEKINILQGLDIDQVIVIEFTRDFSKTTSDGFVRDTLVDKIGLSEIVVGHDHAFGRNRAGDIETLRSIGKDLKFTVDNLPAYEVHGVVVSSSKIRKLLKAGKIREANQLLGRNHAYTGVVISGDGRGRTLSFATANVEASSKEKLLPSDGVYAVYVEVNGRKLKGMMNIGHRPTFNSLQHVAEVHIIDFDENIYGQKLEIQFVDRIRDEFKFRNSAQLIQQLREDKEKSLHILSH